MKRYLKEIFINLVSLYLLSQVLNQGIVFTNGLKTIAITAVALTFLNKAVKPIIKVFFLPINLLTLGMFRWVINVLILFILAAIIPHFQVKSFAFPGFSSQGFSIPPTNLSVLLVLIISSFILSLFTSFFNWLFA